jgi:hypothetical protein
MYLNGIQAQFVIFPPHRYANILSYESASMEVSGLLTSGPRAITPHPRCRRDHTGKGENHPSPLTMASHSRDEEEGGNTLLSLFQTPVEQSFRPQSPLKKGGMGAFFRGTS